MMKNKKQRLFFLILSAIPVFWTVFFSENKMSESWQFVEKSEKCVVDPEIPEAPETSSEKNDFQLISNDNLFAENVDVPVDFSPADYPEGDISDVLSTLRMESDEKKSPVYLQLQYIPFLDYYVYSKEENVTGLAFGYHLPQREINGVSVALLQLFNNEKNGFSVSLIDLCGNFCGMSMFLAGGAVNNEGCLVGLWNVTENNRGVQIGIFNQAAAKAMENFSPDMEISEKGFGFQAGLVNYSDSPGIQFGLWNTNPNSLIPHFPIFNICL